MRVAIAVAVLGLVVGGARAQDPAVPLPLHPITTKPEGQGQGCSFSGSKSSDGTASSTNTCAPSNDGVAPPQAALPGLGTQQPQTSAPAPSASQRFPFPGEATTPDVSAPSPDAPQPVGTPKPDESGFKDAGSSGSSSSSSGSSSSSSSDFGDTTDGRAPGDTSPLGEKDPAPKKGRKKLPPVARQTPDEREAEDVQIAKFYMNDGNWRAAYLRAKDAITIAQDDPDAYLALGDAARKLGKLDEAQQSYKKCLGLDPLPKTKKQAQNALIEMGGNEKESLIP